MNEQLILQAEDDENDVIFLKYVFTNAGITNPLTSVADGQEVVDYLSGAGEYSDRTRYPLPGLVLLDLKMPRLNGIETLRWIRTQPEFRTLVVVMFTASANQRDIDQAYRGGANSFIIKPAGTDRLTLLMKSFHTYWFECNRFARIPSREPGPPEPDRASPRQGP